MAMPAGKRNYLISDDGTGETHTAQWTQEQYTAVMELKSLLGYVMQDITIHEISNAEYKDMSSRSSYDWE